LQCKTFALTEMRATFPITSDKHTRFMNSGAKNSPSVTSDLSRRNFLAATATTVAGFSLVPRHVLGGPKFVAPSEKVNIAIVGCGGQGKTNVRSLLNEADAHIIAVIEPA